MLRTQKQWSQIELSRRAGVSQPTISSYENDPGVAYRAEVLFKIAAALGTTPEYIMKGTGPADLGEIKSSDAELIAIAKQLPEQEKAILLSVAKSMLR